MLWGPGTEGTTALLRGASYFHICFAEASEEGDLAKRPPRRTRDSPEHPWQPPALQHSIIHIIPPAPALCPQPGCRRGGAACLRPPGFCSPPVSTAGSPSRHSVSFLLQDLPREGLNLFTYSSCGFYISHIKARKGRNNRNLDGVTSALSNWVYARHLAASF